MRRNEKEGLFTLWNRKFLNTASEGMPTIGKKCNKCEFLGAHNRQEM